MAVTLTRLPIAQQHAIKALLEIGKSERQTAKLAGVSRATVQAIKNCASLDLEQVGRIKEGLAAKFYGTVDRSLDSITDIKLKASSAQQLMMVAAIGTDKARLIEGKATSRTEFVDATDQAIQEEIGALEKELAELGGSGEVVDSEGSEDVGTVPEGQQAPPTVEGE